MNNPDVSVVIATYNRAKMLADAIDSVLNQDYSSYEVIVSDDGSTDHTPQVLSKYKGSIRIVSGKNQGCGAARKRAIDIARGQFIAIHDSDDLMMPNRITAQAAFLKNHKEVAAVTGNMILNENPDVNYLESCGVLFSDSPELIIENSLESLFVRNIMADPATMIRKKSFDEIGGYDTSLKVGLDWDLWLRMAEKWPLGFINEALTKYTVHESNISSDMGAIVHKYSILKKWISKRQALSKKTKQNFDRHLINTLWEYSKYNKATGADSKWQQEVQSILRNYFNIKRFIIEIYLRLPDLPVKWINSLTRKNTNET